MSAKPSRCDSCGRRLRPNQHELLLSDFRTNQVVGHYHARPDCQEAAVKYMTQPGAVIMCTFVHPDRCGDDQEHCDAGLGDAA